MAQDLWIEAGRAGRGRGGGTGLIRRVALASLLLAGLAAGSTAHAAVACLRGSAAQGDADAVRAALAEIDRRCPCDAFDGSRQRGRPAYALCTSQAARATVRGGRLRASCLATVKQLAADSTCGVRRASQPVPCVERNAHDGAVRCAIVPRARPRGLVDGYFCASRPPRLVRVACSGFHRCVDAADRDGDLRVAAPGDDGLCNPLPTGSPEPSATPVATAVATPGPASPGPATPTRTVPPGRTGTPSPSPRPTATPAPTGATATPAFSATPRATGTPVPSTSATRQPGATATPAPTLARTATPGPGATATPAPTLARTATPRPSATATPAPTLARTATPAPTLTRTVTPAPTLARTATPRPGATVTARPTPAATHSPVCGDGVAEGNEECDGADFDDEDCESIVGGSTSCAGSLRCSTTCELDLRGCACPCDGDLDCQEPTIDCTAHFPGCTLAGACGRNGRCVTDPQGTRVLCGDKDPDDPDGDPRCG